MWVPPNVESNHSTKAQPLEVVCLVLGLEREHKRGGSGGQTIKRRRDSIPELPKQPGIVGSPSLRRSRIREPPRQIAGGRPRHGVRIAQPELRLWVKPSLARPPEEFHGDAREPRPRYQPPRVTSHKLPSARSRIERTMGRRFRADRDGALRQPDRLVETKDSEMRVRAGRSAIVMGGEPRLGGVVH